MNDPFYGAERSITFYVAAERDRTAPVSERSLTACASLALAIVVLTIVFGGCW
jgi:hypothetical protein